MKTAGDVFSSSKGEERDLLLRAIIRAEEGMDARKYKR